MKKRCSKEVYLIDVFLWYALEAFSFHSHIHHHDSMKMDRSGYFLRNILVEQLLILTRIVPIYSKEPNRQYMNAIHKCSSLKVNYSYFSHSCFCWKERKN